MNEEKIQKLLKDLFNLKYNWNSLGNTYTSTTVAEGGRAQLETVIRSFLLDNRDEKKIAMETKIAILEAKVFTYEQIIKNSNFAPMITNESHEIHKEGQED